MESNIYMMTLCKIQQRQQHENMRTYVPQIVDRLNWCERPIVIRSNWRENCAVCCSWSYSAQLATCSCSRESCALHSQVQTRSLDSAQVPWFLIKSRILAESSCCDTNQTLNTVDRSNLLYTTRLERRAAHYYWMMICQQAVGVDYWQRGGTWQRE